MNDLSGVCGGALIAALFLGAICLVFGYKIMQACSVRLAVIGIVAALALVAVVAALGGVQ